LAIHKSLFDLHERKEIDIEQVDRLVVVDANSWGRLDRMEKLKKKQDLEIVMWDHHDTKGNIDPTWSCQESMGANITLMIREVKKRDSQLSPMLAILGEY